MSTLITRIYANYGDAVGTVNELHKKHFDKSHVSLVSTVENDPAEPNLSVEDRIARLNVPASDAPALITMVKQGKSVVAVNAMWGEAIKATTIMEKHGPEAEPVQRKQYHVTTFNDGTPLSTFFGMPVLLKSTKPLTSFWNIPALTKSSMLIFDRLGLPSIWRQPSSDKTIFGIPKLLRSDQSFSSFFGLPQLTKTDRPFSRFFNMPELTSVAAPFSAFFRFPSLINERGWDAQVQGWPKLINSATPFSNFLGLPVLTKSNTTFLTSSVESSSRPASSVSSKSGKPTATKKG
jgi:hypothetical protein